MFDDLKKKEIFFVYITEQQGWLNKLQAFKLKKQI